MNEAFLQSALHSGAIKEEAIDDSVRRILSQLFAVGAASFKFRDSKAISTRFFHQNPSDFH